MIKIESATIVSIVTVIGTIATARYSFLNSKKDHSIKLLDEREREIKRKDSQLIIKDSEIEKLKEIVDELKEELWDCQKDKGSRT